MTSKVCTKCQVSKPLDQFRASKGGRLGRYSVCRACTSRRQSDWRREKNGGEFRFPTACAFERCKKTFTPKRRDQKYCDKKCSRLAWARISNLRKKFALEECEFETQWEAQGRRCAVCGDDVQGRKPDVDHDHETGERRGLLCRSCNVAIGHFKDSPELMQRAAAYILAGGVWIEQKVAA